MIFRKFVLLGAVLYFTLPSNVIAATYYIGPFSGSTPLDDSNCGLGKGTNPNPHPCATLQHWNKNRRATIPLRVGDIVRLAPATYTQSGGTHHCILLDQYAKGVTYEGRTAADGVLDDHESVIIDATGVSSEDFDGNNPCLERGIGPVKATACNDAQTPFTSAHDYTGVIIRDLKFQNAKRDGAFLCGGKNVKPSNILFDRVRFDKTQGVTVGSLDEKYTDPDCATAGRLVTNVTFLDCEINGPGGRFPGSLQLGCMDTATIERTSVHDNCQLIGRTSCSQCQGYVDEPGCDDQDGISGAGAINVTVRDSAVYNVGEDGIDVGGHPSGKSRNWLIERTRAYGNPGGNFKASGGQNVTIRNSFSWGRGVGFSSYGCPKNIYLYNNTFFNEARAVMNYNYITASEFKNNIFVSAADTTVFIDVASTNSSNRWENNVVVNTSGGTGFAEHAGGEKDQPLCDGWNPTRTSYIVDHDCSKGFEPAPIPCPHGPAANPSTVPATSAGLITFKRDSDDPNRLWWFGLNGGKNDRWGTKPAFKNDSNPDAANLKLLGTDSVARNAGVSLQTLFSADYDTDLRPQESLWDIGADEFKPGGGSTPASPGNLRVVP